MGLDDQEIRQGLNLKGAAERAAIALDGRTDGLRSRLKTQTEFDHLSPIGLDKTRNAVAFASSKDSGPRGALQDQLNEQATFINHPTPRSNTVSRVVQAVKIPSARNAQNPGYVIPRHDSAKIGHLTQEVRRDQSDDTYTKGQLKLGSAHASIHSDGLATGRKKTQQRLVAGERFESGHDNLEGKQSRERSTDTKMAADKEHEEQEHGDAMNLSKRKYKGNDPRLIYTNAKKE